MDAYQEMHSAMVGDEAPLALILAGRLDAVISPLTAATHDTLRFSSAELRRLAAVEKEYEEVKRQLIQSEDGLAAPAVYSTSASLTEEFMSALNKWKDEGRPIVAPIDLVLHCPACGLQHIDAAGDHPGWDNPPHRSHLCHGRGHTWRPADVPTNGVAAVKTKGKADSPLTVVQPVTPLLLSLLKEAAALFRSYEKSHRARGPEHLEKAERNADIAARIENSLAGVGV